MAFDMERRDFLVKAGITGLTAAGFLTLGGCDKLVEKIKNRPMRKNIDSLASNDPIILALKDAVSQMKALPSTDKRNWQNQAKIHFDYCPHGNWFFLPWHRAYLFYFESICRQLSGMQDFALPYWDWTCNRKVPSHYWGNASNPLYHSGRSVTSTSEAPESAVGVTVLNNIMNLTNFQSFGSYYATALRPSTTYGELESTPHNVIHGWVGGDMGTFWSPRDPVFWAHHNMIEYCWVEWNVNRGNPNTSDTTWSNFSLAGMFCDKDGNPVNGITVATTLLMPLLSYQYDDKFMQCGGVKSIAAIDSDALRKFLKEGAPSNITVLKKVSMTRQTTVPLQQTVSAGISIPAESKDMLSSTTVENRLLLTAKDVAISGDTDVFVRVFLNKPDATANTPLSDPHYAGSFSFFAVDKDHPHKLNYSIDVTETVKRLGGDVSGAGLNVHMVAVPLHVKRDRKHELSVGGFDLELSKVK